MCSSDLAYQEQVMRIAQAVAGFTLGQADVLRKAMGKKDPKVMAKQKEAFLDGARAKGVNEKKAIKLFELIEFFAGYGFNKSHSTAYALLADLVVLGGDYLTVPEDQISKLPIVYTFVGGRIVYDLAKEWYDWKKMPFVFAVWAVATSLPPESRAELGTVIDQALAGSEGSYGEIGALRGRSLLTSNRRAFWLLAAASVPLWLIFELYNLRLANWFYAGLPSNLAVRYFAYAWAFATIWPGIFVTAALLRGMDVLTTEDTGDTEVRREKTSGEIGRAHV